MELVEFGRTTEYRSGGAILEAAGSSWALMFNVLRRAYERHPSGKFVMGWRGAAAKESDGGLIRSRRAVRADELRSAVVRFHYSARRAQDA